MNRDAERGQDDLAEADEEDEDDQGDEGGYGGNPGPRGAVEGDGQADENRQCRDRIDDDPDRDEVIDEVAEHAAEHGEEPPGLKAATSLVPCPRNSSPNFWDKQATIINNVCPAASRNLI